MLNEFFKYLDEFYPTIKFTMEKSFNNINFLDVTVSKNNNKLSKCLYTTEIDINQYFHVTSCHLSCIKRAIPYGPYKTYLLKWKCFEGKANTVRDMSFEKELFTRECQTWKRKSKSGFKGRTTLKIRKKFWWVSHPTVNFSPSVQLHSWDNEKSSQSCF